MEEELSVEQIKDRLYGLGKKFMNYYYGKDYAKAKHCYDTALTVSCFLGLEEVMNTLWGNEELNIIGKFPKYAVNKVFLETAVKRNWKNPAEMTEEEIYLRHVQRQHEGIYKKSSI